MITKAQILVISFILNIIMFEYFYCGHYDELQN